MILTVREPEAWYKSCENTVFVAMNGISNPHRSLGLAVFMEVMPSFRRFNRMLNKILWEQFMRGRKDKESIIGCVRFASFVEFGAGPL